MRVSPMMRPITYAPRAHHDRAMRYALTRARNAAADAACAADRVTDLKAALLVAAAAFVFFIVLGVM